MPSVLIHDLRFFWDCFWQSTAWLALGGMLSFLWMKRPARAHRVLLLAMVGCLITPLLSHSVRLCGWGLFYPVALSVKADAGTNPLIPQYQPGFHLTNSVAASNTLSAEPIHTSDNRHVSTFIPSSGLGVRSSPQTLLILIWSLLSGIAMIRLLASLIQGCRLASNGQRVMDGIIPETVNAACVKLGLRKRPEVRVSDDVSCPVIWCWGRRPVLLIPYTMIYENHPYTWEGVLCHEMSHWRRRDHLSALFGELLACILPWQPLVWWAKRRLNHLSERASDNWVLACGESPDQYAESLLDLTPQKGSAFALPAVSYRKNLQSRIHNILWNTECDPHPGRGWTYAIVLITACAALGAAFAQTQTAVSETIQVTEQTSNEPTNAGITIRRVWEDLDINTFACLSNDEKYITCPDRNGNIELINLNTGERKLITNDGDLYGTGEEAWSSVLSPDRSRIVYTWYTVGEKYEFRIIRVDGSKPRTLKQTKGMIFAQLFAWASDNKRILAHIEKTEDNDKLVWIDVLDGSQKTIKTWSKRWPIWAYISPDEKYIAYTIYREDDDGWDIFMISTDGGEEIPLVERAGSNERLLGWSPDGQWAVFNSNRNDTWDMFAQRVIDGKSVGQPQLLKKGVGKAFPIGITKEGRCYFGKSIKSFDLYTGVYDPVTEKIDAPETPVSSRYPGSKLWGIWSKDGQYLAYRAWPKSIKTICILSTHTNQEREINSPSYSLFFRWAPDGQSFITNSVINQERYGFSRIDAQTGAADVLIQEATDTHCNMPHHCSPDGKVIYYICKSLTPEKTIVSWNFESGERKVLYRSPNLYGLSLSINGDWISYGLYETKKRIASLHVIPAIGGESRKIVQLTDSNPIDWIEWMPDGHDLLFTRTGDEKQSQIWKVSLGGENLEKIFTTDQEIHSFSINPDGRRIALNLGRWDSEYWVMENFLPKE